MLHHLPQVPERLHQYLPSDCYIGFGRRTKMVMSCSDEWNEMMWAVSRAVEVYTPQTLSVDSNGHAETHLVHHQAFPLILADSNTCMSECFTMLMLDLIELQPFTLSSRGDPKDIIYGIISAATPLLQLKKCSGQSGSFIYSYGACKKCLKYECLL